MNWEERFNSLSLWLNLEQGRFQASRLKAAIENIHHLKIYYSHPLLRYLPLITSTNTLCTLFHPGFFSLHFLCLDSSSSKIHWENLSTLQCHTNPSPFRKPFIFFHQLKCLLPLAIYAFLIESIIIAYTYMDTLLNFLSFYLYLCLFQLM